MIHNLCRPLPPLPAEVPIRSGGRTSALPPAPVSPEGAAGRAEVAAEVGAPGSGRPTKSETPVKDRTSARFPAEVVTRDGDSRRRVDEEVR